MKWRRKIIGEKNNWRRKIKIRNLRKKGNCRRKIKIKEIGVGGIRIWKRDVEENVINLHDKAGKGVAGGGARKVKFERKTR